MLNAIWIGMVLLALAVGALLGRLDAVAKASTASAGAAVTLAIGLVGMLALWLGLVRILHEGGFLRTVARVVSPLMHRLFPEVPKGHPAIGMMILNLTANMLGLGNAATPFGLKAMAELDALNSHKGTATNSMAMFLAINTAGFSLVPTGMMALRASLGSAAPGSIFLTTLLATTATTLTAVLSTRLLMASGFWPWPPLAVSTTAAALAAARGSAATSEVVPGRDAPSDAGTGPRVALGATNIGERRVGDAELLTALASIERQPPPASRARRFVGVALVVTLTALLVYAFVQRMHAVEAGVAVGFVGALRTLIEQWLLVLLIGAFVLYGVVRGVNVYDAVVEGGKEGFAVAVRIIPFLVAMLVAIGMLRAAGAIEILSRTLEPLTSLIGMPAETLPMALLRPLSGNGAYGVAAEIMKTHGPDSLIGTIVSTMQGSTETTFYVLAVYFGAVQVRRARFTLIPCLLADVVGMLVSVWSCRLLLSP